MNSDIKVYQADSRDVLLTFDENSIDSCVCDPPYALVSILKRFGKPGSAPAQEGTDGRFRRASVGFMGQEWDTGETAHDPEFWRLVARAMKPGAYLLAAAGTRTYHRITCAIEDAGFEVRDMVQWLYGTGFPKSHDAEKAIEDMAFAAWLELRPDRKLSMAAELGLCLGDKAREREVEQSFRQEGGPYLDAIKWEGWGSALKPACEPFVLARLPFGESNMARNLLSYGVGALNIDECRIDADGLGKDGDRRAVDGRWPANVAHDESEEVLGDSGSAARFFYSAKADKMDRWGSKHPTVKPIDLMRWLVRLVTPRGGTVLDPFAGSGTTGVAALAEGRNAVLIERSAEYASDIEERLAHYRGEGRHSIAARARHKAEKPGSLL